MCRSRRELSNRWLIQTHIYLQNLASIQSTAAAAAENELSKACRTDRSVRRGRRSPPREAPASARRRRRPAECQERERYEDDPRKSTGPMPTAQAAPRPPSRRPARPTRLRSRRPRGRTAGPGPTRPAQLSTLQEFAGLLIHTAKKFQKKMQLSSCPLTKNNFSRIRSTKMQLSALPNATLDSAERG